MSKGDRREIVVRGAREHNLRNIDVTIPRDQLVVITGVSGSGKSSLAFDTIYAEGQRRYVESLSAYARQFLNQNQKPDVDGIDGLSPAISIEQKSTSRNPRSTVGTLTEVYDYLRLLYARIGKPHCPECGDPIAAQTVQQIVDAILTLPVRQRFMVMAPVVRGRKGEYRRELAAWRRDGFARVWVDGELRDLDEEIALDKQKKHDLELVVDRLVIKDDLRRRLTDSVELALRKAEGLCTIATVDRNDSGDETITCKLYSERFSCERCGINLPELQPRSFSFNSPHGACEGCDGLGYKTEIDEDKIVPTPDLSLEDGAIKPWSTSWSSFYMQHLRSLCDVYDADANTPWRKLKKRFRTVVLYGSGKKKIRFHYESDNNVFAFEKPFEGVVPNMQRRLRETESESSRDKIHQYMSQRSCPDCNGKRLKKAALGTTVGGKNLYDVCALSIADTQTFFDELELVEQEQQIARLVLREVRERLSFLLAVGLDYLSLQRGAGTLSGGEAQRIRLATQIGSALRGVIYVLDEPSIGLHQRDNRRLLQTLQRLRDLGNTVLVVEHDEETMRLADHIIDMGPAAGVHGGEIVAQGDADHIANTKNSLTGDYLSGRLSVGVDGPKGRRNGNGKSITITRACGNNLKEIDVTFPLGRLVCVTGVSGSGKSSLINDTLYRALAATLHGADTRPAQYGEILGLDDVDKVIDIDQSPIGRTPRSNPATYTQLFGPIRDLFSALPESRARGYKPGRYSFNVKGGRCEACKGDGVIRIEMHFLPDVSVTCEECGGKRFNRETLEIRYKGKNIADVLEFTVDEAAEFLAAVPALVRKLNTLKDVGLGYIQLGQSAITLSGGEAQRVKLSRELSKRSTGRTLYILDEPTTGLHFHDVSKLLEVLHRLVDGGNTVVVIEHNLDVIKTADHIIDLGPEGGDRGGTVVATGSPEEIANNSRSHTGEYLRDLL